MSNVTKDDCVSVPLKGVKAVSSQGRKSTRCVNRRAIWSVKNSTCIELAWVMPPLEIAIISLRSARIRSPWVPSVALNSVWLTGLPLSEAKGAALAPPGGL